MENKSLGYLLPVTALLCGALIMVIEVLGSRVIGPFFGVSIFVWTSLITVTMIALAAGYAIGGRVADRRDNPDTLYGLIIASGVLTLAIPLLKGPVLKSCMALGLRGGAFVSSLILFGPPLLLLGCVSPYLIRIAAREVKNIGRVVGTFYAISTVGSVIGTVLTGFYLIAWLGVNQIFFAVGIALVLLGLVYFVFWRKKMTPLLVLLLLPLTLTSEASISKNLKNGMQVELIKKMEGYYGSKKVIEYRDWKIHHRELLIDGLIQGGVDMKTGESIYGYPYVLGSVPQLIKPGGKRCLVIGLGAGIIPAFYDKNGIVTDVVDIDPDIDQLARDYFNFRTTGRVIIEDARFYLKESRETYDYVLLDVFNGDTTPSHLLSLEAFRLMRERLTSDGVLAVNLMGSLEQDNFMTASVIRTLRQVFPQVDIYPNFDPQGKDKTGNISIFAHANKPFSIPQDFFSQMDINYWAKYKIVKLPQWRFDFPQDVRAMVLTDEFNPIDCNDLWLKERVRKEIVAGTDWDILLN